MAQNALQAEWCGGDRERSLPDTAALGTNAPLRVDSAYVDAAFVDAASVGLGASPNLGC